MAGHAASRIDWVFGRLFNGMVPNDKVLRTLELFQSKVLPRVGLA